MSRVRGRPARWLMPPLALLLAACTATEAPPRQADEGAASPFAGCSALTDPPAGVAASPSATTASSPATAASQSGTAASPSGTAASPSGTAASPSGAAADLPPVSLPCFTGGDSFTLAGLRGPAVISLWASWCAPCREELPLMQELADLTAGRLHVVGVDTRDSRDAGASFAADRGLSIPTLFDPEQKLLTGLGKVNLPVTVFVGADGGRYVYAGKPLDRPALGDLVRAHTGVTVTE
ncbi:redoxin domain-containing protein [Actinoplanes sp. NPDC049668]|uniref:TlpA disulfide reductase family protein n=1 Tax=unclassified Actinoplanes TaxID=2626549 RepID=UPI0033A0AE69